MWERNEQKQNERKSTNLPPDSMPMRYVHTFYIILYALMLIYLVDECVAHVYVYDMLCVPHYIGLIRKILSKQTTRK